jgi:hypothetical protein
MKQDIVGEPHRKPNRKMAFLLFCQFHICEAVARHGLTITNGIGNLSWGGLSYD